MNTTSQYTTSRHLLKLCANTTVRRINLVNRPRQSSAELGNWAIKKAISDTQPTPATSAVAAWSLAPCSVDLSYVLLENGMETSVSKIKLVSACYMHGPSK